MKSRTDWMSEEARKILKSKLGQYLDLDQESKPADGERNCPIEDAEQDIKQENSDERK